MRATGKLIHILKPPRTDKTKGGIVLPEAGKQETAFGLVISVGPEEKRLKAGDFVIYAREGAQPIRVNTMRDPNDETIKTCDYEMVYAVLSSEELRELGEYEFESELADIRAWREAESGRENAYPAHLFLETREGVGSGTHTA